MSRAISLAGQGKGHVEPNPMVGCVLVKNGKVVGEGWHQQFGGPHAELEALKSAGGQADQSTAYVSLEPCCHQGKTGPCTQALIDAGVSRVVVGCQDPNPKVAGKGIAQLQLAGVQTDVGVLESQAKELIAPFAKLTCHGRPWVIAKWAATLDGKIASRTGSSQWISNTASRAVVHRIRGVVDAVLVGRGTVEADDPLLTARPSGPRIATRVVLDSNASLSTNSQLVQSLSQGPVLVAVASDAPSDRIDRLVQAGVEVFRMQGQDSSSRLDSLLKEMGSRQWTNVLVEGGSQVFGSLMDLNAIDEVHAFIAPKLIGGSDAPSIFAGQGIDLMSDALQLAQVSTEELEGDIYIHGHVKR